MKGTFTEAIDYFSKKEVISSAEFYQLAAEARVKAFTVSKVNSMQMLTDIQGQLLKTLEEGKTLKEFKKAFDDILFKGGMDPLHPYHIETVFRTNIQTAYQAGRYQGQIERAKIRPYWIYNAVDDSRTSELCYELNGKCYHYDHPFWDKFYPPNHFNCRSSVDDLSEEDLEEENIKLQTEDLTNSEYYPTLPDGTKADEPIKLYPTKGFDINPGKVAWEPDLTKYDKPLQDAYQQAYDKAFGPVGDMEQCQDRLNGLQENFGLMNVDTNKINSFNRVPSTEAKRLKINGYWEKDTGTIGLSENRYDLIKQVLVDGQISQKEQAEALSTLCHEFGHTLGVPLDKLKYPAKNYRNLSQIINDSWARLFFPDFCEGLKLKNIDQYAEGIFQTRDSGYQFMVNNFMKLMESAGLDRQRFLNLTWTMNLHEDPAKYESILRDEIVKLLPGIELPKNGLGISLNDPDDFSDWWKIIIDHRDKLNKKAGEIL